MVEHPEWFRSDRICILDANISLLWPKSYDAFKISKVDMYGFGRLLPGKAYDYFMGDVPEFCKTGKRWGIDIDDIYLPLNVKGSHWVALWISIPDWHITIWDSLPDCADDEHLASFVDPIADMLSYLIRLMTPVEEREKYPMEPFSYRRVTEGVPVQDNGGDCGVYCLQFIEYHALGWPFPKHLNSKTVKLIRAKYAADIYHEIDCKGTLQRDWGELDTYDSAAP